MLPQVTDLGKGFATLVTRKWSVARVGPLVSPHAAGTGEGLAAHITHVPTGAFVCSQFIVRSVTTVNETATNSGGLQRHGLQSFSVA